jgi:GntR family transcriptional regulator
LDASESDAEQVLAAAHRKGLVEPVENGYRVIGVIDPTLTSIFQHAERSGMKPTSEIRAATIEPASEQVVAKLAVPLGAPVYRLVRTRNVNGEVVANQVNFIPYEVCPGLENDDMTHFSFQRLLEVKYHAVFSELKEEMEIRLATESDREILGLPEGAHVLVVQRVSYSITGQPVVWAEIHIRTDRFQYVEQLWPAAAPLLQQWQTR